MLSQTMGQEPTCEGWLLTIDACWGTGCAPVRSPSTARSSQPASVATSSRPGPSSFRSSAANGTTPSSTIRRTGLSSSSGSSRTSTEARECGSMNVSPGQADHPCNNTYATVDNFPRWLNLTSDSVDTEECPLMSP